MILGFDTAAKVDYLKCGLLRGRSSSSSTRSPGMARVRFVGTIHWPAGSASASWASGGVNTVIASLIASSMTPALKPLIMLQLICVGRCWLLHRGSDSIAVRFTVCPFRVKSAATLRSEPCAHLQRPRGQLGPLRGSSPKMLRDRPLWR